MKTFFLRILLLCSVLMFGVILGMSHSLSIHKEQHDIEEVEKVDKTKVQNHIEETTEDARQIELMLKQEKARQVPNGNFYSELGMKISDAFQHFFSKLASSAVDLLHSFLNER